MNDLSDRALLTLQEARRFVFRGENDTSRDDLLIDAVNYVSDAIADYCEREFVDTTITDPEALPDPITTEARTFALRPVLVDGYPVGHIDLAPYDLRTVSVVTLYTDRDVADQAILASDEFSLRPIGRARGGTFLELLTIAPGVSELQRGFGWQASVEGEWGMAAIPTAVMLACAQWVENIVKNPGSYASQTMAGFSVIPEIEAGVGSRPGMPAAVRYRLAPFRRR